MVEKKRFGIKSVIPTEYLEKTCNSWNDIISYTVDLALRELADKVDEPDFNTFHLSVRKPTDSNAPLRDGLLELQIEVLGEER